MQHHSSMRVRIPDPKPIFKRAFLEKFLGKKFYNSLKTGQNYFIQQIIYIFVKFVATKNDMTSVADPGCLSRIPDPDFYPSRIQDLGSRISDPGSQNSNKREGWKKNLVIPFI